MYPRLKVSNLVTERLEKLQDGCFGHLYGVHDDDSVLLLGFYLTGVNQGEEETSKKDTDFDVVFSNDILPNLPAGIVFCGGFRVTNESTLGDVDEKLLDCDLQFPVFINFNAKSKKLVAARYEDDSLENYEFTVVDQKEVTNLLLNLRINATFSLQCDSELSIVDSTLEDLEKKILSGNAAFQFEESNVYILGDKDNNINGILHKSSVNELLKLLNESDKGEDKNEILKVQVYMNQANNDDSPKLAPFIKYIKKKFKYIEVQISLDAIITTLKTLPITHLYKVLVNGTHRNFLLHKQNLLNQLEKNKLYDLTAPETYHFLPRALGHFFSIVYSSKENADNLKKIRETFHKQLALPMDKPLFRQANAYDFSKPAKSNQNLLLNPHESVAKSGVPDGQPYLVQGLYAYHHYMQDNYDDNGWGCAYRSLQTIFSWFRLQGYTTMAVPSHREIQQCLVNIGDKPASFVGSKQWIGSTEVSFVLDTMLGVTSRIVSVSSGEEMTTKGGELSHHFRTQGTPIMIGGGVLAHTILGIDYNKNTGDIKFLILDPHYTGEEDLNVIVKKGWCGWKGPDFWKKDAFYNMCLPLTPKCV